MKRKLTELSKQIHDLYEGGVRPTNIAKTLQMSVKNVNNRISVMRKAGLIKRKNAGTSLGLPIDHPTKLATVPSIIFAEPEPEPQSLRDRLLSERSTYQSKVDAIDMLLQVL